MGFGGGWRDRGCGAAVVVLAAGLVGCAARPADRPATVPVSGTVRFAGEPVAGATVGFQAPGEGGRSASGITDPQGRYQLSTFTRHDGAVPGEYDVIVFKFAGADAGSGDEYVAPQGPEKPPRNELPAKYADPKKSGLKATVGGTAGSLDFDLTP